MKLLLSKLGLQARRALWGRIAVVSAQRLWRFAIDDEGVKVGGIDNNEQLTPLLVIAGRSHCFEIEKHIPAGSLLEAWRVAKFLAVSSPFEGIRKARLVPAEGGGYRAFITIIDNQKIENTLSGAPRALIPISWLLDAITDGHNAEIDFADEKLGFSRTGSAQISMLLDSDKQRRDFWWAVGSDLDVIEQFPEGMVAERMAKALSSLGLTQWVEAFRGQTHNSIVDLSAIDWTKFGRVLGALVLAYMISVSAILNGIGLWAAHKSVEETPEFSRALKLQGDVNRLLSESNEWQTIVGEQHPVWTIWPVIKDLSRDKIFVRTIGFDSGVAEVTLLAEDATDVLTTIISSPYAQNVEFASAVVKDRRSNLDSFSIRWVVQDDGVIGKGSDQ